LVSYSGRISRRSQSSRNDDRNSLTLVISGTGALWVIVAVVKDESGIALITTFTFTVIVVAVKTGVTATLVVVSSTVALLTMVSVSTTMTESSSFQSRIVKDVTLNKGGRSQVDG
jgi:hypothetical protein